MLNVKHRTRKFARIGCRQGSCWAKIILYSDRILIAPGWWASVKHTRTLFGYVVHSAIADWVSKFTYDVIM